MTTTGSGAARAKAPRTRHDGWTAARRTKFLDVLARTANVVAAANAAGMSDRGAYRARKRDAAFAEAWEEALACAVDELEAVAFERAKNGIEKVVVRGSGKPVSIREYSDRLLMFMLSRRKPALYAQIAGARVDFAREREIRDKVERRVADIEARRGGN